MAGVPLNVQLFNSFLGSQQGIHSIILPDIFSSGGSQNVMIDKFARVLEINGYSKQNSSAFTTTNGDAALIRGLIPYRETTGGAIVRKLIFVIDDNADEWEVFVSTDNGATATRLESLASTGKIPSFAQYDQDLYVTNGTDQPRKYDGSSWSTTGLTQSPTITASASSSSGNITGTVQYKLVSLVAGVRQNGSVGSTLLTVENKQVSLSWTEDSNTSVDAYEIYRTTGTGTTFYYLTTLTGRATASYTDNTSDATILQNRILQEHGDPPPSGAYFAVPHKQRIWWLRTDSDPTKGWWSDPGIPESVYGENFLDFSDSETVGDQITGAVGNYQGLLIVFTEKAVWTVSGTGLIIGDITDWTKIRTNAQAGASGRSMVRIPAGSKYTDAQGQFQTLSIAAVAYFTPLGDIRIFDSDNDLIISHPVKDLLATFNYTERAKIHVLEDHANGQVIWFFPTGSSGECDTAVAWNYKYGVWYEWTPMPFGASCWLDTSTTPALLLTGEGTTSKGGYIYSFLDSTANSFDGTAIKAQWMTKTLYGINDQGQPALSNRKRYRWIDVLFKLIQSTSITVEWLNGAATDDASAIGSVTITPAADSILTADGSTILTADGSSILVALQSAQVKAFLSDSNDHYLHDEGIRLRIGTNGLTAPWALEAMNLAFQVLPGLKHRDQL